MERKTSRKKIAEWPPPSVNKINLKARLGGLIPKILSQETIINPGVSVGMMEETPEA